MKCKLLLMTLFACGLGWGQDFNGEYSFEGTIGNVGSLSYNGSAITNLTVGALTKTGVTTSSSSGNSRASGWGTGSTNGGAAGGSIDLSKYFEFTITADSGYTISNPTLTYGVGRSSTGTRRFEWRWSIDSYGSALSVGTSNGSLINTSGVLETPDSNSGYTGNVITTSTSNQTTITFRFYAYGAESNTGTGGLHGNLTFGGTLVANGSSASTTYTNDWSNSAPTASVDAIIDGDLTTSGNLTCEDLTINSGKTLTIAAGTTLSVSGNLVNNGSIIFKSNNTSTGRFDSYSGNPITGTGSVTMERYIDGKRAFRFLAPGVTTTSTIANNWQQQVFITGSTTVANAGGFDVTETGAPSMFTFEDSGWAAIANTGLTLNAQKGYRILIRGDRTPSILTSPSNGTMNTPVTLIATGTMVTGDVPYTTLPNQDYTLVANPYISPINWATVTKSNISDTYYAWDPNLGTGNQRGRYVSCDVAGNTSIISGTGSPSTDVDQFIQPGQAVFIQKTTSGVNGSVTIKETDKAATFTDVFRTPNNSSNAINGKLGVNLYESLAYSIGEYPIDGAVVVSGTTFNTNSASDDTKKIMSHGEQVAFVRDNIQLGIEKISAPQENDELSIACVNLVPNKNYVWSVVLQDGFSNEDAYLYDAFTQMYHPLTGNSVISFNTTDDVNSSLVNRFKIVFQNAVLSNTAFQNTLAIYPNPAKAGASFYIEGISEATVTVSNLLGQTVPVQTKSQGTTLQVTPNTSLSQGVYLVNITTQGTTQQVKWIVE